MYFCNLDKLKLVRTYNFKTVGRDIHFPKDVNQMSAAEIYDCIKEPIDNIFTSEDLWAIETAIELYLFNEEPIEVETFETIVNIATMVFSKQNTLFEKGRKREYRLGLAATKLGGMHINYSLLKDMINHQTRMDNFNFRVIYNDLTFDMCQPSTEGDSSNA